MITETYRHIRGFNFQPPWGSNGRDVWLRFDGGEYRRILRRAKSLFPGMNTVRVWLSFDAWLDDRKAAAANMKAAGEILRELGLFMIPVYCNGWHSTPDFGGFTPEVLAAQEAIGFEPYRTYVRETAAALEETGAVLLQDISNEPLNNFVGNDEHCRRLHRFLAAMGETLRSVSGKPLTISSQCMALEVCGFGNDVDFLQDIEDVITLHPYSVWSGPLETHRDYLQKVLDFCRPYDKPVIITECCWGASTDEERGRIVDTELRNYRDAGIGFVVHALAPSPVADLHPEDYGTGGLNMPFMTAEGAIRPFHDCYNKY